MGQVLRRIQDLGVISQDLFGAVPDLSFVDLRENINTFSQNSVCRNAGFPDLSNLPPELGLEVLSHLNATDLCLASCVWSQLANDELLWLSLCRSCWGSLSICRQKPKADFSYKKLFMTLDEACLTFNSNPDEGIQQLTRQGILEDTPMEIAKFIHFTKHLWPNKKLEFLQNRQDVLERVVQLQNFENQFLPNALRKFFKEISAPRDRGQTLHVMIENFSKRFCTCNPQIGLSHDSVFVLCFSLIMLSVDLCSPHVKNKMSKREFIKNTCRAVGELNDDLAGHMYDNIYLAGHVAPKDL